MKPENAPANRVQSVVVVLVAALMFLIGAFGFLVAKGWFHRPVAAAPPAPSAAPGVPPTVVAAVGPSATAEPTVAATAPPSTLAAPPLASVARAEPSPTTATMGVAPPVANAEATLARMRPGFRSCYNHGLAVDRNMSGKLVIAIHIRPDGDVDRVDKVGGTGLSADVEKCILRKATYAIFDAPGGKGSVVQVPITFVSPLAGAGTAPTATATAKPRPTKTFDPLRPDRL
jgi:hypothetical protein